MIPALPCISRCIDHYIISISYSIRLKCLQKPKSKPKATYCYLFTALHIQNSCCMLNVPITFEQPTNNKPPHLPPPSKKKEFTHTHIQSSTYLYSYQWKSDRSAFQKTCLTHEASKDWPILKSKELKYCWNERATEKSPRAAKECSVTWEAFGIWMRGCVRSTVAIGHVRIRNYPRFLLMDILISHRLCLVIIIYWYTWYLTILVVSVMSIQGCVGCECRGVSSNI